MKVVTTIDAARVWRKSVSGTVGFVPTMGFLHVGHLSLVERARRENDAVAASLFVNPTQFAPGEDLARYPRSEERDRKVLQAAGTAILFAPSPEEMFPPGCETRVDVGAVAGPLEGERRPGHFQGVATVVLKLFHVIQPDRAYFGEKDAQQLAVIRRMVRDLDLSVEVVGCPTVREPDGLALSSRNTYLQGEDRRAATVLYRALRAGREAWERGARDGDALRASMRAVLVAEPRATIDYVSAADPVTLREVEDANGTVLLSLAVRVGPARLIDNMLIGDRHGG